MSGPKRADAGGRRRPVHPQLGHRRARPPRARPRASSCDASGRGSATRRRADRERRRRPAQPLAAGPHRTAAHLGRKFVAAGVLPAAIALLREGDVDMLGVEAGDLAQMTARAREALLRAGSERSAGCGGTQRACPPTSARTASLRRRPCDRDCRLAPDGRPRTRAQLYRGRTARRGARSRPDRLSASWGVSSSPCARSAEPGAVWQVKARCGARARRAVAPGELLARDAQELAGCHARGASVLDDDANADTSGARDQPARALGRPGVRPTHRLGQRPGQG